jgi:hypothetical protein
MQQFFMSVAPNEIFEKINFKIKKFTNFNFKKILKNKILAKFKKIYFNF